MSEEERIDDPLLGPFTDLDNRKIPIQDDKMRGWVLVVYLIFLIIGVPVWWYCTKDPSNTITIAQPPKNISEFVVNAYFEEESIVPNWKEYSFAVGNYFFNVKNKETSKDTSSDSKNLNIIFTKDGNERIKTDKRTLKVPNSIDIKTFLTEIVDSFNIPNLQKSEIKLKFTFLTTKNDLETEKFSNLNNFISNLSSVLNFKATIQTKYFDEEISELTTEMFIGSNPIVKFDSRDERGRTDLFNFVFILTDSSDFKSLFIPNWGIIVKGPKSDEKQVEKVFISGLKRLLGFPKEQKIPEMFEIELWIEKLKEFYYKKSLEMSKSLSGTEKIEVKSAKEAFDIIESAYNDPKLLAAAYFPDDHKFAVYLPVYLSLILPILVGLVSFIKTKRKEQTKIKED